MSLLAKQTVAQSSHGPTTTVYENGLRSSKSDLIKSIETFRVRPRWLFVRVETEKGIVGWGEATLEGHSEAVEGAFADFRERFVGWDASNIEDIYQSAYRHRFYRGGEVLMSALSGYETSLLLSVPVCPSADLFRCTGSILLSGRPHLDDFYDQQISDQVLDYRRDIKGKTLGVPVWELLGGKVYICPNKHFTARQLTYLHS